ncbi:MAG: SET domain-containing protein-lysine N-methyltransferase [Gemmatimonadota bacterium]
MSAPTVALLETPSIIVGRVEGKGRGVYAARVIEAGEILDLAPVSIITAREAELLEQTPLAHHYFHWDGDESDEAEWRGAIAYGLVSLVNHAEEANAGVWQEYDRELLVLEALRPIAAGEEISIHYDVELWFDVE